MSLKKIIITITAIASIVVALYGVQKLSQKATSQPVRQTEEIR